MNFSDFQDQTSSEKIVLATIDASKRLMGWSLHSDSIYKLENIPFNVIVSIEDSGTSYNEVNSIEEITTSKFYLDRTNQTLYLETSSSDNPNSRFIAATFRLFFSNIPVTIAHDLDQGFEVFWEPLILKTSEFGVEIDTINQMSEAIEGSGTLTLINDQDFWVNNFDKLVFENKPVSIYSYHRELQPSDAQLIFQGTVEKKTYNVKDIKFNLKDLLAQLRTDIPLSLISELEERTSTSLVKAKQRMIFGRVFGHRPVNLDEVLDGYPITGTVSVLNGSSTITGTGTQFLAELSPDDRLIIEEVEYTIGEVTSDTELVLTEDFTGSTDNNLSIKLIPDQPKRWMNRRWKIAGHPLKEPIMTTLSGCTVSRLHLDSTEYLSEGDDIYVGTLGSGELATVDRVINSKLIKLKQTLITAPSEGVQVIRPCVQNLRIGTTKLRYYDDYTADAENAEIELREEAEANSFPIRQLSGNLEFNLGQRIVSGEGLDVIFRPGYLVSVVGHADFIEVLSVSETELILREPSPFTATATGLYKAFILNDEVVSCDVLGRTDDGTTTGSLLRTGPDIVYQLLTDLQLDTILDFDSFELSSKIANQDIGIVIPSRYNDIKSPTYRDIINQISKSILGSLVQTNAFQLKYMIIRPSKNIDSAFRLKESDILSFKTQASSEYVVKTVLVEYRPKEYDFLSEDESVSTTQKTSDNATYLLKTDRTRVLSTYLVEESNASVFANQWSTILDSSSGIITLDTKLQASDIEVGDLIDLEHRKLFVRFSGSDKRRLLLVERVKKNGSIVSIEAVDLSNLFNRVGCINDFESTYADATEDERLYGGFITDEHGLIDNDPDSFGTNLIF